jgi:KRAB domain-containing zinc finger protein
MSVHEGRKDYKCETCGKTYVNSNQLKTHFSIKHEGKRHVCDSCGKSFTESGSLNKHIKAVHEGRKDYKCKYCTKAFNTNTHVRQHEKSCPSNEQKVYHNCDRCDKSFIRKSMLNEHIRNVHEGRKIHHKCDTCGKLFAGSNSSNALANVKKHIDTVHLGLKKYQCSFCNTAYGQNGDLTRHIKRCHSKEKQTLEEIEKKEKSL